MYLWNKMIMEEWPLFQPPFFNAPCCSRRPSHTCTAGTQKSRRAILLFALSFFRGSLKLMCFQMQGSGLSHGPAQL